MPMLQSSLTGAEVQRRYGELASQTLADPSHEAPTTRREPGSKCAVRIVFSGPSRTAIGSPCSASATTTVPSAFAASTSWELGSNSAAKIML
jgi:hypothetical protein